MMCVDEFHNYLSMVWYGYSCADKDKITEIFLEEINHLDDYKDERDFKLAVKRRCQAEA